MLKLFGKKPSQGETIKLQLSGLHCASCSLNIDDALEETHGVYSAKTNYAKQESIVNYDPQTVHLNDLTRVIENLGYKVVK